jgi:hypothetical protein
MIGMDTARVYAKRALSTESMVGAYFGMLISLLAISWRKRGAEKSLHQIITAASRMGGILCVAR